MRAIYTTREGQKWELKNVEPIRFAPGFYYGDREDNGELVQVHEHRLKFVKDQQPAEQENAGTQRGRDAGATNATEAQSRPSLK